MSIPLLDRESIFEVYQVINLPIPYPQKEQGLGVVAKYQVETEYIVMNSARMKFMMLTAEEAKECCVDALGMCSSLSPIYMMGNHRLWVLEQFKGDKERIKESSQVEIQFYHKLLVSLMGSRQLLPRNKLIYQGFVGENSLARTLRVGPSLSLIELLQRCSAFGVSILLPLYHQVEV